MNFLDFITGLGSHDWEHLDHALEAIDAFVEHRLGERLQKAGAQPFEHLDEQDWVRDPRCRGQLCTTGDDEEMLKKENDWWGKSSSPFAEATAASLEVTFGCSAIIAHNIDAAT